MRHAPSRPTLSDLHQRLQKLEASPLPSGPSRPVTQASGSAGPPAPVSVLPGISTFDIGGQVPSTGPTPASVVKTPAVPSQTSVFVPRDDETIYGPSSNISFLRQVTLAADQHSSPTYSPASLDDRTADTTPTVLGFSASQPKSPDPPPEPMMLPERWLADSLTRAFWEFVHPVFPILHRPSFIAAYEALWKPVEEPRKRDFTDVVFHSTLSIVLALGSQRTDLGSVSEQDSLADKFYKQSLKLVSVDTLDHSSLQVVQLLLLRGVHLHYTSYADRCWNTVGLASRVAQGLGLHSESDRPGAASQLRREMRRRVWHCCLTLDRLTATTFGRPVLLSRKYSVPPPAAVDDEYLSEAGDGAQPRDRPSYLAFFNHSLALFDVLDEVLARFYADGDYATEQKRARALDDVLRLSSRLDDLSSSVPAHLREGASRAAYDEDVRECLQMQANILKSRVLWIRLLLLRPLLLAEAKQAGRPRGIPPAASTLRENLRHAANNLCVETAHAVLQELHEKLGSVRQNSAWHVLLFTFAAASTLVVATLCPGVAVNFDADEPTKLSWHRALRIFDFHRRHVTSAARGIEVLQKFRDSVVAVSRRGVLPATEADHQHRTADGDVLLPLGTVPSLSQTPGVQDLGDFLSSDLLNESWFNNQGIDFGAWPAFQ
ncbi:Sorbicillinoid biosynthetic cluster transcription factor 2 [Colletotrichum spinosum]|uniref:Sorbicillinoid biosynthetic cluster transcription factor 2 n=1 Tax=Colletotrichum spinosum TaxID=1347390 RepID=A0A4R8Q238_9PEZI|nr:Sorbicillinoid biosynthetic cluster transcription factor 2 [Colletotrichum spinosum]